MMVDKKQMFEGAQQRWPESIRITPVAGYPAYKAEPKLGKVYRSIEGSYDPSEALSAAQHWDVLADWAFYQALLELVEETLSETVILREDVRFNIFDRCMRLNLSAECWRAELVEYQASARSYV